MESRDVLIGILKEIKSAMLFIPEPGEKYTDALAKNEFVIRRFIRQRAQDAIKILEDEEVEGCCDKN